MQSIRLQSYVFGATSQESALKYPNNRGTDNFEWAPDMKQINYSAITYIIFPWGVMELGKFIRNDKNSRWTAIYFTVYFYSI